MDFEKKLLSKEKVYEIVKNIYSELQNTKVSKTFNLTEAVFMLRNMDEFNFFTKENGRIMFEKKIDLIDDEEYEDKNSMRNHIDDFSELEIKELVKSFQLPKQNEEEMLVAVLSGSSYIYQIVHGLNCIFTNDMVRFIRDGNKTISEDWAEIDMVHSYIELYSLVEKKNDDGKKVLTAVKKISKKAKEARKENEASNQNIEDLEKDQEDDRFEENNLLKKISRLKKVIFKK